MEKTELLTQDQVCDELGISRAAYFARVRPTLRVVRVGRRCLIRRADLEEWIASQIEEPMQVAR